MDDSNVFYVQKLTRVPIFINIGAWASDRLNDEWCKNLGNQTLVTEKKFCGPPAHSFGEISRKPLFLRRVNVDRRWRHHFMNVCSSVRIDAWNFFHTFDRPNVTPYLCVKENF